eukprot:TRINITY_DN12477_c0_g1_i1.p1 TRINITY_DN12477_c0_g1~~TRINITY_DN12477_c0_g1_i1.p1  ORF type:complete len:335 (-),score=52.67 TRINITY_DN12477_c0_g1_i1:29-1033(-)
MSQFPFDAIPLDCLREITLSCDYMTRRTLRLVCHSFHEVSTGPCIYLFGGFCPGKKGTDRVYMYNGECWQEEPAFRLPHKMYGFSLSRIGTKLVLCGGYKAEEAVWSDALYVYDLNNSSAGWVKTVDALAEVVAYGHSVVYQQRMFTLKWYGCLAVKLEPTVTHISYAAQAGVGSTHGCALVHDKIYQLSTEGELFSTVINAEGVPQLKRKLLTLRRAEHKASKHYNAAVTYHDKVYFIGGAPVAGEPLTLAEVFCFDPAQPKLKRAITRRAPMPTARQTQSAVVYQGKIWVIGGLETGDVHSCVVESYDVELDKWQTEASMPSGISYAQALVF